MFVQVVESDLPLSSTNSRKADKRKQRIEATVFIDVEQEQYMLSNEDVWANVIMGYVEKLDGVTYAYATARIEDVSPRLIQVVHFVEDFANEESWDVNDPKSRGDIGWIRRSGGVSGGMFTPYALTSYDAKTGRFTEDELEPTDSLEAAAEAVVRAVFPDVEFEIQVLA